MTVIVFDVESRQMIADTAVTEQAMFIYQHHKVEHVDLNELEVMMGTAGPMCLAPLLKKYALDAFRYVDELSSSKVFASLPHEAQFGRVDELRPLTEAMLGHDNEFGFEAIIAVRHKGLDEVRLYSISADLTLSGPLIPKDNYLVCGSPDIKLAFYVQRDVPLYQRLVNMQYTLPHLRVDDNAYYSYAFGGQQEIVMEAL